MARRNLSLLLAGTIQARTDLTPHETLVGIVLALAVDGKTGRARLKRETIQARTHLSRGQLTRAVAGLVDKGVVARIVTGRATIYAFSGGGQSQPPGKEEGRVDGPRVGRQAAHGCASSVRRLPSPGIPGWTAEGFDAWRDVVRDQAVAHLIQSQEAQS